MYASHVDFDSFVVFMRLVRSKKSKGKSSFKLKVASVWPFNACNKVATG